MSLATDKNPHRVRAGKIGATRRWGDGPPKVVKLDDLTIPQRRVVIALVDAAKLMVKGTDAA